MKSVLIVTDVAFWEKNSGNRIRIYGLIEYLAQHVLLTVVNTVPSARDIESSLSNIFNAYFFVLEKTKYLNSNGYGRRLKAFLKDKHYDTITIEYIPSSYFLNFFPEDVKIIIDAHDIISDRADEFKKINYAGALYEMKRETEIEIFNIYDHVIAICQPDYDEIVDMVGPVKALLCPHPIIPIFHPFRKTAKNIAFIASAYLPNIDAINWFIVNCWPQICQRNNVWLNIYGTVCSEIDLSNCLQISLKGFVSDKNKIYEETDIIINPVRFGAGLKIKNIEALAHGVPLVTTTHGTRGIQGGIDSAFLIADDAHGFR
ncbi:MAG: hypothetical protein JWP45_1742 [Mucilaginibacter sp.]|nr:hypothetical protein [Mucilaginibacter sp.]